MIARWRAQLALLSGSGHVVAAAIAISFGQSLLLVPIVFLVREAFNHTIPDGEVGQLALLGAVALLLFLASAGFGLWTRLLALRATKKAIAEIRGRILAKLTRLPVTYFDRGDSGTLHSTIVMDTERLDQSVNAVVSALLPTVVIAIALGATLLAVDPLLGAVVLVSLSSMVVASRMLASPVRTRTRAWQRAFDVFSKRTQLSIRSVAVAKLHGAEEDQLERSRGALDDLARTGVQMAWAQSAYSGLTNVIAAAVGILVLVVGGALVSDGKMTLGDLISFYAVLGLLRGQLAIAMTAAPQAIAGDESLERLQRILDEPALEPYRGTRRIDFTGAVALEGVDFSYEEGSPVLRGFDLAVEPGETVALLGVNGAGKSTVINLIAGLYAPQGGTISADGTPLPELDMKHLRRSIGVVVQDPLIFPASVRENVAYGRPGASDESIARALELAGASSMVAGLPSGLDTNVGDDGVLLSGGQRQRIAIARALLGEPALLMLDEPTTHLDAQAAAAIVGGLVDSGDGPAVLVVSHDATVAERADRSVVLRDGRAA